MNADAVDKVAVLGLGTMGHGIAQTFAAAGCEVCGYDPSDAAGDSLTDRIRSNLQQMIEAGIGDSRNVDPTLARITVCASEHEAVDSAQFIVEAVREDLEVKKELFARIESWVGPEVILASNSSSYPISETADRMRRPERAVVTHWFNPPHIVPVVEVVPGKETTEQTAETTCELLRRVGKRPVRLRQETIGFLVNRVQIAMLREVWDLLERGVASAEDIDRAIRGSMGMRLAVLGPLQINDFAGWDVMGRTYEDLVDDICSDRQLPSVIRKLIDAGHLGVKTGEGVFGYGSHSIEAVRLELNRRLLKVVELVDDKDA